jgi:putative exporter of polyketide antibiotics
MDSGQTIYILCQLGFGAAATFLAIMLWPKIRDVAWMLVIFGTIVSYIEIVYSILKIFGVSSLDFFHIGSVPLIEFILPTLRMLFFIVAFAIMIKKSGEEK